MISVAMRPINLSIVKLTVVTKNDKIVTGHGMLHRRIF